MVFPIIIMAAWLLTAIVESVIIYRSVKWYYENGLIVYRVTGRIASEISIPINNLFLESLPQDAYYPKLIFQKLEENKFSLREKYFTLKLNYPPVMRGTVIFDYDNKTVNLIGFLNVFPLLYFICILIIVPVLSVIILPIALLFLYIFYNIQCKRFNRIFDKLTV